MIKRIDGLEKKSDWTQHGALKLGLYFYDIGSFPHHFFTKMVPVVLLKLVLCF